MHDVTGGREPRTVAAWGRVPAHVDPRDRSRHAGFPMSEALTAAGYDKGHLIARATGGGYDANIFAQAWQVNQGRSADGRRFRRLETLAAGNPDALFLARLIYADETAVPSAVHLLVALLGRPVQQGLFTNTPIPRPARTRPVQRMRDGTAFHRHIQADFVAGLVGATAEPDAPSFFSTNATDASTCWSRPQARNASRSSSRSRTPTGTACPTTGFGRTSEATSGSCISTSTQSSAASVNPTDGTVPRACCCIGLRPPRLEPGRSSLTVRTLRASKWCTHPRPTGLLRIPMTSVDALRTEHPRWRSAVCLRPICDCKTSRPKPDQRSGPTFVSRRGIRSGHRGQDHAHPSSGTLRHHRSDVAQSCSGTFGTPWINNRTGYSTRYDLAVGGRPPGPSSQYGDIFIHVVDVVAGGTATAWSWR